MRTYVKTDKLKDANFRGQKALIVAALNSFSTPKSVDELEEKVTKDGYKKLFKSDWALEKAGGVHGSLLYHLRQLDRYGMVKVEGEPETGPRLVKKAKETKAPRKKKARAEAPPPNREEVHTPGASEVA